MLYAYSLSSLKKTPLSQKDQKAVKEYEKELFFKWLARKIHIL